jgi:formate dehydrogenase major subunit
MISLPPLVERAASLLQRWPVYQDLKSLSRGRALDEFALGETSITTTTRAMQPRIREADAVVASVCPYCAVGCGQLVYVRSGRIIDIEGNPASPVNAGTLCPKGAATFGLLLNPSRVTTVRYRAPYADHWEKRTLDWAMERIAHLVKATRDAEYQAQDAQTGKKLNRCFSIASLGGATLDNEENYLIKKLFGGGLGMVWIENQARI